MILTFVLAPIAGILALIFTAYLTWKVLKEPVGTKLMQKISEGVREGAMAYLRRQYKTLIWFVIGMFIILVLGIDLSTALAFVIGAIFSVSSGYIGMNIATKANVRTAEAARKSLSRGLRVAFLSGGVMGLNAVGLGVLGVCAFYIIYGDPVVHFIAGFGLGASSVALFARVGGGIYTKGADVGADLVGKVEKKIPEDDPRNAAVIADQVGDNVGDVAGMGADLFESYVSAIIATMVLGMVAFEGIMATKGIILPLLIAACGIVASIIGTFLVRLGKGAKEGALVTALRRGVFAASFLVAILSFIIVYGFMGVANLGIFYAILAGLIAGILIGLNTEYFTLDRYKPTRTLAESSQTGAGVNIISGIALGMQSTAIPIIVVGAATYLAYYFAGLYGIAIAGVGMLSTLGITLASDAYGPVADNASGIAQMAKLGKSVRRRTDALDELGNTTAATGKGFAIGSAALTTLGWIAAYIVLVDYIRMNAGLEAITLSFVDPNIIIGLFIGGMITFLFCSITMRAVGKTAFYIVNEVRRQFREIKGLMEGKAKPDYAKCVDISTKVALKEMIAPGLIAVIVPIIIGFTLGPGACGALLLGATATGFLLAIMMANAGGAWDNAKKYIEKGHLGGKGSETHKVAVIGDIVGDPFKDTAGPSLNILIKLMSKVALVFAPLFAFL